MTPSLLQRVAAGEPGAVQGVLDQYGGLVWSLARRFSANQTDAEDAVQEIFLDVWKSAARFDPTVAGEATFVSMIARRRLIDRNRRSGRRPGAEAIHEGSAFDPPDAERAAQVSDDAGRAARAFKELSQEQQRVLRLSIFHGLSHEKISAATGLPLGTVKTHARRGLIRIREVLESDSVSAKETVS
ncbi:MAG TPA: RNA polymerase subunit sigma-24 [Phycisphaerales bacterium]|nr:RNA polymerase subunit sigma-24 [Phycisphaerales bacterium]